MAYPMEEFPDISDIDWRTLPEEEKRTYWRERKMEFLASQHQTVAGFIRERGIDENTYWQAGWSKDKALVVSRAEMMANNQMSSAIADVIQLAYNVEEYAIAVLSKKLQEENSTMKVTDLVAIVNLMRLLQGKPSVVAAGKEKREDSENLNIIDIDGNTVREA